MFEAAGRAGGRSKATYAEHMSVSARDVAREIRRRVPGVGDVKVQKLLYYCQGHHLAVLDAPLFSERVSAFDMGPVVGELWYAERNHLPETPPAELDEAALNTIGYVVSRYGGLSGPELVRLTHGEAPWQQAGTSRRRSGARSVRIPEASLRDHFREAEDEDEPRFDQQEIEDWLQSLPALPERRGVEDPAELERQIKDLQARRSGSS